MLVLFVVGLAVLFSGPAVCTFPAFDEDLSWKLVSDSWRTYPNVVKFFADDFYPRGRDIVMVHQVGPGHAKGSPSGIKAAIFVVETLRSNLKGPSVLVATYASIEYYGYVLNNLQVMEKEKAAKFMSEQGYLSVAESIISDVALQSVADGCTVNNVDITINNDTDIVDFLYPSKVTVSSSEVDINIPENCNMVISSLAVTGLYQSKNTHYNASCIAEGHTITGVPNNTLSSRCDHDLYNSYQYLDPSAELEPEIQKHVLARALVLATQTYLIDNMPLLFSGITIFITPSVTVYTNEHAVVHMFVFSSSYTLEKREMDIYYSLVENRIVVSGTHPSTTNSSAANQDVLTDIECFTPNTTELGCVGGSQLTFGSTLGVSVRDKGCPLPVYTTPCATNKPILSYRSYNEYTLIDMNSTLTVASCIALALIVLSQTILVLFC